MTPRTAHALAVSVKPESCGYQAVAQPCLQLLAGGFGERGRVGACRSLPAEEGLPEVVKRCEHHVDRQRSVLYIAHAQVLP